jgi:hypothetical protein
MPDTNGNDPMCLDDAWTKWSEGYFAHKTPEIPHLGIGYMLASGGMWSSNTDPYAMKQAPDNEWGYDGPHVMILVPDVKALGNLPTHRMKGSPYVMWAGTPYAHVMVPMTDASMMSQMK